MRSPTATAAEKLDRADIQGIVLSGYAHLKRSAYLLLSFDGNREADSREWLRGIAPRITSARGKQDGDSLNIAFTYDGMRKLGLDAAALSTFPFAFADGMASARRASILSDDPPHDASAWRWGGPTQPVDVLLLAYAVTDERLDVLLAALLVDAAAGGLRQVVSPLRSQLYDDRNEHFGFSDGIAQPILTSLGDQRTAGDEATTVSDGEFVLGYRNEYGFLSDAAHLGPGNSLGKNGTYLVFRQTTQDVAGLWQFIDAAAGGDPVQRELLAAKMVGRWKSGAPLVSAPTADPDPAETATPTDDFGYAGDPDGLACPFGSHIRRSNPRDGLRTSKSPAESLERTARHRLLRRGRSYGPRIADPLVDDGVERGLHFICLCSDLERQFEFVQQTWINNPVFGQLVGEVDPIVGSQTQGDAVMTIPRVPIRLRLQNLKSFVELRGGAYFFLPSLKAVQWLARPERANA